MTGNEYQKLAMRTNDGNNKDRAKRAIDCDFPNVGDAINAALGLSGETGELNDMLKKAIFHGHAINSDELAKELGDILWYVAEMCDAFGFELEYIMQRNIEKLMKRYPDGFSEYASQHRGKDE